MGLLFDALPYLIPLAVTIAIAVPFVRSWLRQRRRDFVLSSRFPDEPFTRLKARHPHLGSEDLEKVGRGLKHFFLAYVDSGYRPVAMPSLVAADLWAELAAEMPAYDEFCRKAFGGRLEPSPAVALGPDSKADNAGLRNIWWHTCITCGVNPSKPKKLPLLFALDHELGIGSGFAYRPQRPWRPFGGKGADGNFCYGGDFGSTEIDGTLDGFGPGDGGCGGSSGSWGDGGDGGGDGGGGD